MIQKYHVHLHKIKADIGNICNKKSSNRYNRGIKIHKYIAKASAYNDTSPELSSSTLEQTILHVTGATKIGI